ncbi:MAG TPA: phosphoglucosamine mutase [Bacteroidales bacterium]|nr:phosphoglucosamine mutase [Bacteroidales bacterium]HPS17742.1 phosphoglucosamine mutase [Bacteroidales bacterium]
MTLIKSISGIRGTIGGKAGNGLTPADIVKFTAAYLTWLKTQGNKKELCIIIGRDARISGPMVCDMVCGTAAGMGVNVIDVGLATTPTVEMMVAMLKADGGIIITASHNPKNWNALKLLNSKGEFLSASDGNKILEIAEQDDVSFCEVERIGKVEQYDTALISHINKILELPLVDKDAIAAAKFRVAIDCVNSVGGIAIPALLEALGVTMIEKLYCEPNGVFPHNPEPLPEHLEDISKLVIQCKANVGFVVDPDVDRLAIICENGEMFGEEYTLVAVADYILKNKKGNTVSNLSSTRALQDVTEKHGGKYFASAVGEVNVVEMMKKQDAVIGGEGNGGVIYPDLHNGRDALVGIALFLTHLAKSKMKCSTLRDAYPNYFISKNKIELEKGIDVDNILKKMTVKYNKQPISTIDGVRVEFEKDWVHLRKSNTEPIIRIYAESDSEAKAETLAKKIIQDIKEIIKE